jgi:hypothetical protein
MALPDANIFGIVLSILHLNVTEDVIEALAGLDEDDFYGAFLLHASMRRQLEREESRTKTEAWMKKVDWDNWQQPTEEYMAYLRMVEERSAELWRSGCPIELIESAMEKIKKNRKWIFVG